MKGVKTLVLFLLFLFIGLIFAEFIQITFSLVGIIGTHISLLLSFLITRIFFSLFTKNKLHNFFTKKIIFQALLYFSIMEIGIILFFPIDNTFIPEELLSKANIAMKVEEKECPELPQYYSAASMLFKNQVNLSKVKLIHGGSAETLRYLNPKRVVIMTDNNTIYLRKGRCMFTSTFIHEIAHVFQFQKGLLYGPRAFFSIIRWLYYQMVNPNVLYNYGGKNGLLKAYQSNRGISYFGIEQQAQIVENYYNSIIYKYDDDGKYIDENYNFLLKYYFEKFLEQGSH